MVPPPQESAHSGAREIPHMASAQAGFPTTQVVGGVVVPSPYELWADGVWRRGPWATSDDNAPPDLNVPLPSHLYSGRTRIAHRPIWISGIGETIDTHEPLIQLTYVEVIGRVTSVWLSRGQVTDHHKLLALGNSGVPVDSVSAKEVLVWLREVESANGTRFTPLYVGHRSGPYIVDGKQGWLLGKDWIGTGKPLQADPRLNQRYTQAFTKHGSFESWLEKYREVRQQNWVCRFLMGATFAPPLLRHLRCRTFLVHHWGQSGAGKTAISVFALSAWGNPELLYSSLNRTAISITEVFRHLTDLPVLYDEKQVATVESDELIYSICTGTGRERGAKDGGLRQDKPTWLTIARTTGEVPLITDGDVGGQFNRVLQIHSPSFTDRKEAEKLYPFSSEHHGHAGAAFLMQYAKLLDMPGGLDLLVTQFKEMRTALAERVGADTNHAGYAAIIALAQTLADTWLLDIPVADAKAQALADAYEALRETAPKKQQTYAERALSKLRDHWVSQRMSYMDATSARGKEQSARVWRVTGIEAVFGMLYIPHEANALLMEAGYAPERVWRDFHALGWLITDPETPDAALAHSTLLDGKSLDHGVYIIKADVFYRNDRSPAPQLQLIPGGVS